MRQLPPARPTDASSHPAIQCSGHIDRCAEVDRFFFARKRGEIKRAAGCTFLAVVSASEARCLASVTELNPRVPTVSDLAGSGRTTVG